MWKERLHRLLGRLHLDGRDISVFLMSLLLAFSIWLIHNLSLNYSDTISVQGRNTQGVKLIELQKRNDTLMSGCIVPKEEEDTNVEATTEDTATESSEEEA